jgi:hypothetical protein
VHDVCDAHNVYDDNYSMSVKSVISVKVGLGCPSLLISMLSVMSMTVILVMSVVPRKNFLDSDVLKVHVVLAD